MLSVPSEWQAYEVNGWFPSNPSKECKRCPSRDQTFISCGPTQYQKLRQIKSRYLTLSCSRQPFQPDELPAFLVVAPAALRRAVRSAARPLSRQRSFPCDYPLPHLRDCTTVQEQQKTPAPLLDDAGGEGDGITFYAFMTSHEEK